MFNHFTIEYIYKIQLDILHIFNKINDHKERLCGESQSTKTVTKHKVETLKEKTSVTEVINFSRRLIRV